MSKFLLLIFALLILHSIYLFMVSQRRVEAHNAKDSISNRQANYLIVQAFSFMITLNSLQQMFYCSQLLT